MNDQPIDLERPWGLPELQMVIAYLVSAEDEEDVDLPFDEVDELDDDEDDENEDEDEELLAREDTTGDPDVLPYRID